MWEQAQQVVHPRAQVVLVGGAIEAVLQEHSVEVEQQERQAAGLLPLPAFGGDRPGGGDGWRYRGVDVAGSRGDGLMRAGSCFARNSLRKRKHRWANPRREEAAHGATQVEDSGMNKKL